MARIIAVGKYYPPYSGGIEANTQAICEALLPYHDIEVICFNDKRSSEIDKINGVRVHRVATNIVIKSQPVSLAFIFAILQSRADIYHLHAPNFMAVFALTIKKVLLFQKFRLIITHHTDVYGRHLLKRLLMPLYHYLAKDADAIIVTSDKLVPRFADLPRGCNFCVIPLSVDVEQYGGVYKLRERLKARLAADNRKRLIVGFLGRHARYKGLKVLLAALAKTSEFDALIGGDGPYRAEAEEFALNLGIQDRVRFLGNVEGAQAKADFFDVIDLFAFPSTEPTETFGISQLEAMLHCVPVVASNLATGVTDVSIHEKTAILAEPGNPHALAEALQRLMTDKELRKRLTSNAFENVMTLYSRPAVDLLVRKLFSEI